MKILAGPDNWGILTKYLCAGLAQHDLRLITRPAGYPNATFQDVLGQLPQGWHPDLVIWWLPEFQAVLPGIEECPYPTLALISDWHVLSDPLRAIAPAFDAIATDRWGLERLRGVEGPAVFEAPLYGFDPSSHHTREAIDQEWDIIHVGDLHPYLQNRRVEDLARVAEALGDRYRVKFCHSVFGDEYRRLLQASRITIHRSLRGEMSMRCYEAPACGSLLFCEEENQSTRQVLHENVHCIYYNAENLLEKLVHYLEHERERAGLARAGQERIQDYSYAHQAQRLLEQTLALLKDRPRQRQSVDWVSYWAEVYSPAEMPLLAYAHGQSPPADHKQRPGWAWLRGCIEARASVLLEDDCYRKAFQEDAIAHLEEAAALGLLPGLSLARVQLQAGHKEAAIATLAELKEAPFESGPFFPRQLNFMSVQWERDKALREATARWQVYELLAQLVPEKAGEYSRKALEFRADAPLSWFRLALLEPPQSPARRQALERCCQLAPTFWAARRLLGESHSPRVAACFGETLREEPERVPESSGLEGFLKGIHFDWLQPQDPLPVHFCDREGGQLEYTNTRFPGDDAAWKKRLLALEGIPRMGTLAVAGALQTMVHQMSPEHCFVNVGVWHGYSFLAALLENPDKRCIGVDNFSQFGGPREAFLGRLQRWGSDQHRFFEMDYRDYFARHHQGPLGVYLYDGEHSYANQLEGLKVAEEFLVPGTLVLVDDTNWEEPRQATLDFVAQSSRQFELLLDVRTAGNHHPTWWNGWMVWRCLG